MHSNDKDALRSASGGSSFYAYRLLLATVAPLLLAWGICQFKKDRRAYGLAIGTLLLLLATLIGKAETLQKINGPLLIAQIFLALYLTKSNRLTLKLAMATTVISFCLIVPTIVIAVTGYDQGGALRFFFYRVFDIPNEILFEHFVAIPYHTPFAGTANIRPLAALIGQHFAPTYDTVAQLWRQAPGSTSTAMFIGDAWHSFSYAGVAASSVIVGAACRSIDLLFLWRGRTPLNAALLSTVFIGVYNLMVTGIQTAAITGGLLICPIAALILQHLMKGSTQADRPKQEANISPDAAKDAM